MSDLCGTIRGAKYRSTNRCVYSAKYHVIWCPKHHRRAVGGLFVRASHARFVRNLAVEEDSYFRVAGRLSSSPNSAVRFRLTRPLLAKSGMARVTLDVAGRWHVPFTGTQAAIKREPTGSDVGIDRGAAKHAFARVHVRAVARRRNWREITSIALIREHDLIVLEDLRINNMVRKPNPKPDPEQPGSFLPNQARAEAALNRSIHRSCWGLFAQRLQEEATVSGVTVIKVHPAYTCVECRTCGHAASENRQSQAAARTGRAKAAA